MSSVFFCENLYFWVCQHVFFVENRNASTLRRARASVRDPRVVFAKGARTACGSAGNAIKFAREANMSQNVTMSFDLATALEVRSVHRLSRLTPNMLRLTTPYVLDNPHGCPRTLGAARLRFPSQGTLVC